MTTYTIQCIYPMFFSATTTIEAASPEDACAAAIEELNDGTDWEALDHIGPTFVERIAVGAYNSPWDAPYAQLVTVPPQYTEESACTGLSAQDA